MKSILILMYIRTLIEIVPAKERNKTMQALYTKCGKLSKSLGIQNRAVYAQSLEIAIAVWEKLKEGKKEYEINIEPTIAGLYFCHETEFKKLGFKHTVIDRMYNYYFSTHDGVYENKSRKLGDEIMELTEQVMLERIRL